MRGRFIKKTWVHDPANDYVPAKYRRACRYEAFIPEVISGWAPSLSGEVAGVVSDAERAIMALSLKQKGNKLAALSRLLLRAEAIASSKIEGMQVDTRDLARAEARYDLGIKIGSEARTVLAGIDAMQLAIDMASEDNRSISKQDLLDIHQLLMKHEAAWTTPGNFRTEQNWIGGNDHNPCDADFVPPPASDVPMLLDDLIQACEDESLPVIVQAAIIHAQFETIHPFNDGNGRVGRTLIHALFRRRALVANFMPPVSVVLANKREQYIEALTRFRAGEVHVWINLFAACVAKSVVLAKRYLDEVEQLQATWRSVVEAQPQVPRSDSVVWILIDQLPAHPILTTPVAVASTGRSKPAVSQAILYLVSAGVLEPLSTNARNRSWEPVGLINLVERLENGQ